MTPSEVENLLKRYRLGLCSEEEKETITYWYDQMYSDSQIEISDAEADALKNKIWESLVLKLDKPVQKSKVFTFRKLYWSAAAVVLLCLSFSLYYFWNSNHQTDPKSLPLTLRYKNDVNPASFGGVLTIDGHDNDKLPLDSISVGAKHTVLVTNKDGFVQVKSPLTKGSERQSVTIRTDKGQNLKLLLEDGTKIWLNAGSEIAFALPFQPSVRKLKMTGEAYFEVAKEKKGRFWCIITMLLLPF